MEAFAFRWALGVDGVLAALAGYGFGHAIWNRGPWTLALAALVASSAFALAILQPNPNLTSYSLLTAVLAFGLRRASRRAALAGMPAGLTVAVANHLLWRVGVGASTLGTTRPRS